jgi:predicted RNA-binding protein associated with RNAse of E/G family
MIDLDLDVGMRHDGIVVIEDEDEFEVHQVKYRYTAEMITRAVDEADRIVGALRDGQEPFFEVAEAWLRLADPH